MTNDRKIPLDLTLPCLTWEGDISSTGYGRIMIDGDTKYVHRLSYQLHVGPIGRSRQIDHACHNAAAERGECEGGACAHRACYEPSHLEQVSSAENSRRGNHPLFRAHRHGTCRYGHDLSVPENQIRRRDGSVRCAVCAMKRRAS